MLQPGLHIVVAVRHRSLQRVAVELQLSIGHRVVLRVVHPLLLQGQALLVLADARLGEIALALSIVEAGKFLPGLGLFLGAKDRSLAIRLGSGHGIGVLGGDSSRGVVPASARRRHVEGVRRRLPGPLLKL